MLQPAIRLADDGFAATPRFVSSPNCSGTNLTSRAKNSPLSAEYFCPGGLAIAPGTVVTNKPLADTFRLIARHGADCFYKVDLSKGCDIALGIVEGQTWKRPQAADGRAGSMTLADLEAYQPATRAPIEGTYRGYRIKSMAPPSSGALTVIQILKMLERFPLADAKAGYGFGSVKTLNVMADAMRIAFADRAIWMADADFVHVSDQRADQLQLPRGARRRDRPGVPLPAQRRCPATRGSTRRRESRRPRACRRRTRPSMENGTTHFSVVDKWGNVVSYTNTIESGYGIGVFAGYKRTDGSSGTTASCSNNELTDFNTTPTPNPCTGEDGYNDVQPNKRPRSSMAPTMIFTPDGKPFLAYGSPGGATIINSVRQHHDQPDRPQDVAAAGHRRARISVAGAGSSITLENVQSRLRRQPRHGLCRRSVTPSPPATSARSRPC